MRNFQQSAHPEVDLVSIEGVYVSNPLTSRLLGRHGEHYSPCTYTQDRGVMYAKTKHRTRRDPPCSITPMYGSRPRTQMCNEYRSWCAYCVHSMSRTGARYHLPGTYVQTSTCAMYQVGGCTIGHVYRS